MDQKDTKYIGLMSSSCAEGMKSIYSVNWDNTELSLEQDFYKTGIRGSFIIPIGVESRCESDNDDKKLQ